MSWSKLCWFCYVALQHNGLISMEYNRAAWGVTLLREVHATWPGIFVSPSSRTRRGTPCARRRHQCWESFKILHTIGLEHLISELCIQIFNFLKIWLKRHLNDPKNIIWQGIITHTLTPPSLLVSTRYISAILKNDFNTKSQLNPRQTINFWTKSDHTVEFFLMLICYSMFILDFKHHIYCSTQM
jgi:hypothetical protein